MADDAFLEILLDDSTATYGLQAPVAGSVRLHHAYAHSCTRLEAALVFIRTPADLRGWSDTAVLATDGSHGAGEPPLEFPFLFTTPAQPVQGTGEWYVEVDAHLGRNEIVRARRRVTLPMQTGRAKPKRRVVQPVTGAGVSAEPDVDDGPWTVSDLLGGFVFVAGCLTMGLFGAALGLDLWNRGIPLGVQGFGFAMMLGGVFAAMQLARELTPLRVLVGAVLVAATASGLYMTFVNPGWAPLRPTSTVAAHGYSVLQLASTIGHGTTSPLVSKARVAWLTAYLLAMLAGWVLGQVGRRGALRAEEMPLALAIGPLPALLAWLSVCMILRGDDRNLWMVVLAIAAVMTYAARDAVPSFSRYPLASLGVAGVVLTSCVFEWQNTPARGLPTSALVGGWAVMAVAIAYLGNGRGLAERALGEVAVQLSPENRGVLGRPLRAVVAFTPRQLVRGARLRLRVVCEERTVDNPSRQMTERTYSTNVVWQQAAEHPFADTLPAGQAVQQALSVMLPSSVRHSGTIGWELRLDITVANAPDWSLTMPLTVDAS